MTETELIAFKETIKQEVKAEIKAEKKGKKKKGKDKAEIITGAIEGEVQGLYYTKREPRKAFSTFMRNQNKFYVNSFNVIDRKAAIMIRVNSTIISAIVLFFQYVQDIQYGTFIGLVMVFFSFVSMMAAIDASRPHVFSLFKRFKTKIAEKHPNLEQHLFAVGMHHKTSIEDYEEAYNKIVNSQELQIGNQIRAMFGFEKQTHHSFHQIELAYIAFMIGFSIVVLTFIIGVVQGLM